MMSLGSPPAGQPAIPRSRPLQQPGGRPVPRRPHRRRARDRAGPDRRRSADHPPRRLTSRPLPHGTGNIGAATLPLQLAHAADQGRLRPGAQAILFRMASGASGGVMLISW
ncbi:3-oxoacyl-[acyl-carrier-protein] synthase III C-terminal domain-containing protein [Streptomyces sp. NPDC017890]|uniref:3-oxoacyl-[acyl-carrier-protein] synthase III C-terminal domain-containing protein n=1 Tax=Streptomyces sp. NPDC017890 TaxID=3365015 RepID=UPI003788AFEA